jgi:16S rRNA (cytosine967-C5)-methyltransferase
MRADVVQGDALSVSLDVLYDVVLLDAPCSATGTLRRHPDVAYVKSDQDVQALARQQAALLERAARWVKPSGYLIFCTCSLEQEETEDQIERFLSCRPAFRRIPYSADELAFLPEALTKLGDIQTLPCHFALEDATLSGMGGFFVSRLQLASGAA